ncbi:ATP-binding protein [Actinokineospora sp. G85]|uniref:ATP-binding protein n=1 Tax=Actinokineospora sp. G85 TaxID=3406626 RepID=UPI003C7728FD
MSEVEAGAVETSQAVRPHGVRTVEVRVSADAEQVPLVRSFAADIAMRMDFDLDAIEDLRMAVDEACLMLVRAAVPGTLLECRFEAGEARLALLAAVDAAEPTPPSADAMSWRILTALAESAGERVEAAEGGHRVSIELSCGPSAGSP